MQRGADPDLQPQVRQRTLVPALLLTTFRAWGAQVMWNTLISVIPLSNKSHSQIQKAIAGQVKKYQKLLDSFCGSVKLESALMVHIQAGCSASPCGVHGTGAKSNG